MSSTEWQPVLAMQVTQDRITIQGPAAAPVTLFQYGDYECPYSGAAYPIKEIQTRISERSSFVFRNFPITSHPHAQRAAESAEAAGSQGRSWEMHDLPFENQRHLHDEDLRGYAKNLGLDVELFDKELGEHVHAGESTTTSCVERRERYADLLHQRCKARRFVRDRDVARCPGVSGGP